MRRLMRAAAGMAVLLGVLFIGAALPTSASAQTGTCAQLNVHNNTMLSYDAGTDNCVTGTDLQATWPGFTMQIGTDRLRVRFDDAAPASVAILPGNLGCAVSGVDIIPTTANRGNALSGSCTVVWTGMIDGRSGQVQTNILVQFTPQSPVFPFTPASARLLGAVSTTYTIDLPPDATPPAVSAMVLAGAHVPNADSLSWLVSFDEDALNVTADAFVLTTTGSASGTIASVTGSGTAWTVTVETVAGEGTIRLDLRPDSAITDEAGNGAGNNGHVPAFTGEAHAVDRVAPAAPVIASPADGAVLDDTTPTLSGSAEANATVAVSLNGAVAGTATANGAGNWDFTVPAPLADGIYALTATATDTAGNLSAASVVVSFTIDTAPAPPPVGSGLCPNITASGVNTVRYSTVTDACVAGSPGGVTPASNPGFSVNVTSGQVQVRFDGNVPPTAAIIGGNGCALSNNSVVTNAFQGPPNCTVRWSGTIDGRPAVLEASMSGTHTPGHPGDPGFPGYPHLGIPGRPYVPPTLPTAFFTTVSGISYEIAPALPVATIALSGASAPNADTVSWTVTFDKAALNVTADAFVLTTTGSASGTIASVTGSGTDWTVTVEGIAGEGAIRLDLKPDSGITNEAGNGAGNNGHVAAVSGETHAVDRVAPDAPVIASPVDGDILDEAAPTISGTAEAGSTVAVLIDNAEVGTTTADGAGAWSLTLADGLADGTYGLTVVATDAAGNVSAESVAVTFTIDTTPPDVTPPVVTAMALVDAPALAADSVSWAVSFDEAVLAVTVADFILTTTDTASGTIASVAGSGTEWTVTVEGIAGEGSLRLDLKPDSAVTDEAGNGNGNNGHVAAFTGETHSVDRVAPAAPVIASPVQGDVLVETTPTISGAAEAHATVAVLIDGVEIGTTTADGTGAWGFTLADALAFGPHVLTATATDAAGNVSIVSAGINFIVAEPIPDAPVITGDAQRVVVATEVPEIRGTARAGSTVTVRVAGAPAGTTTADGSGNWRHTLDAALERGTYAVTATAANATGGVSEPSAAIDLAVIAPTVIVSPVSGGNAEQNPAVLVGTAEPGVTLMVWSQGARDHYGDVTVDASGDWSFTMPSTNTAAFRLQVYTQHAWGTLPYVSSLFRVDITPPAAPVIASPADGALVTTATPAFTGTGEADAEVELFADGISLGTTTVDGAGGWTFTPGAPLADGTYVITATATDTASNVSVASAAITLTVDATAPDAPVIASPADGVVTLDNRPTITGTAEAGSSVEVFIDAVSAGTVTADGSGAWSFAVPTALADGTHAITATATDAAGHVSATSAAISITVDATAPDAPVITGPADGLLTNNARPTLSGTAEANATVEVFVDGASVGTTTANGAGSWSFTPGTPLADGVHSFTATATDAAGHVSPLSVAITVVIDTVAPDAPVILSPVHGGYANTNPPIISGTAEPGAEVKLYRGPNSAGSTIADEQGNWSVPAIPSRTSNSASWNIRAFATDQAGNTSNISSVLFTLDATPPAAPVITGPADGEVLDHAAPTFTGTTEANATVELFIDGASVGTVTADGAGAWSFTPADTLADGAYALTTVATDAAGNASETSAAVAFAIDTTPPAVSTMALVGAPALTADTVAWSVSFDEAVQAVVVNDFTLTTTGTASGIIASVAGSGTEWTVTVEGIAGEGSLRLDLKPDSAVTDEVGNGNGNNGHVAAFTGETHSVDRVAPDAPVVASPVEGDILDETTPTISGAAEAHATVAVLIDGVEIGTTTADAAGDWSFTPATALAFGDRVVTATATDAAGNVSIISAGINFIVAEPIPDAPVITGDAQRVVVATEVPEIRGTARAGSTVTVRVAGAPAGTTTADGSGNWRHTLDAALERGTYAVTATAANATGGVSEPSAAIDLAVIAPTVIVSPADGVDADRNPAVVTGTAEPGVTLNFGPLRGAAYGEITVDASGDWSFIMPSRTTSWYRLVTRTRHEWGSLANVGVYFTVDIVAPAAPVIASPADGALVTTATPAFTGTAEADAEVELFADDISLGTTTVDGAGDWTFTPAAPLADGVYAITATATDTASNVSVASTAITLTVDATAPDAPVIASPADGVVTLDNRPTITGTAEAGSSVEVFIDAVSAGTVTADGSGAWSFTPATLADGTHAITATATDAAGHVSAASAVVNIIIDTTPPVAPVITSPVDGQALDHSNPILTGTTEADATVELFIDGASVGTTTADGAGAWSLTLADGLADGTYGLTVVATDAAGNVSAESVAVTFTIDTTPPDVTPPVVTAMALVDAPALAADSVSWAVSFDEAVLAVTVADFILTTTDTASGTIASVAGSGTEWTVTVEGIAGEGSLRLDLKPDSAVTDEVGNGNGNNGHVAAFTGETHSVDRVAPAAPVIASPVQGDVLAQGMLAISGTAEARSTVDVRIDGASKGTVTADGTGVWSLLLADGLADGTYGLTVVATDVAGNVSVASAVVNFTIDTTAPDAPVITSPVQGALLAEATVVVAGRSEADAIVTVSLGGVVAGTAAADGAGNWSLALGPLADGAHAITATATDGAGNVSAVSQLVEVIVDLIAPDAPVIQSPVDGARHAAATITVTGTAEADATVELFIDAVSVGTTMANGVGHWEISSATLADGTYRLTAMATDAAGHQSAMSAVVSVTVDATPPDAPVITSPTTGSVVADASPTITGTAEADATVEVFIDGVTMGTTMTDASGHWSLAASALADGLYAITATATDATGHVSPISLAVSFTVDATAPDAPVVTGPVEGALLGTARPLITGTAEARSTVLLSLNAAAAIAVPVDEAGNWNHVPVADLPDGVTSLSVRARDAAGNVSDEARLSFSIDTVPAMVPVIVNPIEGAELNTVRPVFTGTTSSAAGVTVYVDGDSIGTALADDTGQWSLVPAAALAEGEHQAWATATSAAGNVSAASPLVRFSVDTVAPDAPLILSPVDGAVFTDGVVTVTGTSEAHVMVEIFIDGVAVGLSTADGTGNWRFTTDPLADGDYRLTAVATDAAGNVSAVSTVVNLTQASLRIETGSLSPAQVGVPYMAELAAAGGVSPYRWTMDPAGLPPGLNLSEQGRLSGVPTASGDHALVVVVTDAEGRTASVDIGLRVAPPAPPEVSDVRDVTVHADPERPGEATEIDLSAIVTNAVGLEIVTPPQNGTATVEGLRIFYMPRAGYFGTDSFTYRAIGFTDGGAVGALASPGAPQAQVSAPATITVNVAAPVLDFADATLAEAQVGVAYSQHLSASGGTAPYRYALTGGALPEGLSLDADGRLSGLPTAGGDFSFTITATDSSTGLGPFSVQAAYGLRVAVPVMDLDVSGLVDARIGEAYDVHLAASGGTAPYRYAVSSGALPQGLVLSSTGRITGTPTAGGRFDFTVTVTDSSVGDGPYSADHHLGLNVQASVIVLEPAAIPVASRGVAYAATVTASGGTAPYRFSLDTGALPAGLTLSDEGQISGTPETIGVYSFQVRATDSSTGDGPYSGVLDMTLTVEALSLSLSPSVLPDVLAGTTFSQQMTATGGQGGYGFAVTTGVLPEGVDLSTGGLLSGRPTRAGAFAFTITATDGFGNSGSVALVLTVEGRPDPSIDPDVRGLSSAQADATRRFAQTQVGNFGRRLEQLHTGRPSDFSMGLSLDGSAFMARDSHTAMGQGELGRVINDDRAQGFEARDLNLGDDRLTAHRQGVGSGEGGRASGLTAQDAGQPIRVWTGGVISLGHRDASSRTAKLSIRSSGISVGADMSLSDRLDVGIGMGLGREATDVGDGGSRLEGEAWTGVVYASWRPVDGVFVDGLGGYGRLSFDTRRRTPVDGSLVFGQRDGAMWFGALTTGVDRRFGPTRVIGYGRLEGLSAELDAYVETGSPLWALRFEDRSVDSLQLGLGFSVEHLITRRDVQWAPGLRFEWNRELGSAGSQSIRYADWLDGPVYGLTDEGWSRSRFSLGLSLHRRAPHGWSLSGEIDARLNREEIMTGLRLIMSRRF